MKTSLGQTVRDPDAALRSWSKTTVNHACANVVLGLDDLQGLVGFDFEHRRVVLQ
jgi:hypothetical protein